MGTRIEAQPRGSGNAGTTRTGATGFGGLTAALLGTAVLLIHCSGALAQDAHTPGSPTVEPAGTNLLASFQVKPGFRIELVASEPMVTAPVAMAFDENGRLFVVEMPDHGAPRGANVGRVRMLDNMNDKGVFQNSTIYADRLAWPSAVACYAGGIFVATTPEILYLKDTKGDGIADARQAVMSGFGRTNVLDPNLLPNNFNWGLDNRIHAASAGVGGDIWSKGGSAPVSIAGADFCFDPRTLEVFAETGPSESGLTFDSHGRKLVSDFPRPLSMAMYELRYMARNPYFPKVPGKALAADPLAPVYRFAQVPGQSGVRRPTNLVAAPLTMARGCVVYRGRAFPTNYFDNVFVTDPIAHVIHRMVLHEDGLGVLAQRAPDERNTEFLISRDPSFRPVQIVNGPDGALYVVDMQEDSQRGRIYRIVPNQLKQAKMPQIGRVKTYDLVSMLAQGDGWHRDTAARLLYERRDPAAPALLRGTLNRSRLGPARVLALHALAGAGALTQEDVLGALRDLEPEVRQHGLIIAETLFTNGIAPEALLPQFKAMATDSSLQVRYQLAFTLGELDRPDNALVLGQILGRDVANPWVRNAVLSARTAIADSIFAVLAADAAFRGNSAGFEFLRQMAAMIGVSGNQDAVAHTADFIARGPLAPGEVYALFYELGQGLHRTRSSLALVDTRGALQPYYTGALNLAADPTQSEAVRTEATRFLSVSTMSVGSVADWLLLVCSPPTGPALQSAAVETLSRYDDPKVVDAFLRIWPVLMPMARSRAISFLLSKESHVPAVLAAVQSGSLAIADLTSAQRNFLRTYHVDEIRARALQLLGPVPTVRPASMETFKPALSDRGAVDRGREIFVQRCAQCHRLTVLSPGLGLGPDLLRARTFTKERLLGKIIQPNLGVRPDYATQVLESKEGESMLGIISDVNRSTLTLAQMGGTRMIWPQLNVSSVQAQSWSLMPEGLEFGMSPQDMADLMEFVLKGQK